MDIVPVEKLVNKSAIETLDEMRVLVESGEVVAIAIATVTKDGGISGDVSSGPNQILMWSSLQHMTNTHYEKMIFD